MSIKSEIHIHNHKLYKYKISALHGGIDISFKEIRNNLIWAYNHISVCIIILYAIE